MLAGVVKEPLQPGYRHAYRILEFLMSLSEDRAPLMSTSSDLRSVCFGDMGAVVGTLEDGPKLSIGGMDSKSVEGYAGFDSSKKEAAVRFMLQLTKYW